MTDLLFYKLKDLITEQSAGEWDEAMIVRDAHHFANNLRPLFERALATPSPDADKLRIAIEALERGIKRCETYEHIRLGGRTETAKKAGTLRNAMSDMRQALQSIEGD